MALENNIQKLVAMIEGEALTYEYVFVSLGHSNMKAQVKLFKNRRYIERDINKYCQKFKSKTGQFPQWIKVDIVTETIPVLFDDVAKTLIETRRNYVDFGIALDKNWHLTFLPEEINANAFVRPKKGTTTFYLSDDNINNYLKKYTGHKRRFSQDAYYGKMVTQFYTQGFILDGDEAYQLHGRGYQKNLRKVDHLNQEIDRLIANSTEFLGNMLLPDGKYIYGYFPHFDKKINFYNMLRHSSSTYSLIEGLAYLKHDIAPAERALDYVIEHYIATDSDGAKFVFDDTKDLNEIKLGQNAAFIFAVCEYLKHGGQNRHYLEIAQGVAAGILKMIDAQTGETIHILNYPDFSVKEKYRIVYYDGEAALALLRLYQQDKDERWLKTVQTLFEYFISHKYWQYHDHWLGYCTNELVQIVPEEKYFRFGINNVSTYLDYMKQRETTFPTFLEMLMATYHLVEKAKSSGYHHLVDELLDEEKFLDTIHTRADYERTGFFYPEIAMYFKNPSRILNSFFIKHHGYRVRIDDIEHYLSGYVQYQHVFNQ
ncbi:poly(glycerol-phosphate) alpha-glucosyltransferase [Staphylococcus sp. 17KM0847]|uniref:poly(glycerol-phosphate) alpha-glucosyltransferase n=1 Tax=Staphylococcus sp. 17KM0847 TaxID=2583989 RepID=UPI0015DD288E|nr:poly(glycerol-phosphate) alpha-glucosyltransferase [Staphylococcus sp. 17KM0847]QLK86868.1 poly(glycerol-phosphate) alpha-glucosyltransferase [Staphylococcus sp. 17KM0847]